MNVYRVIGQGWYGGGMAIVAARDESRAKVIAGGIVDNIWRTDYAKSNDVELLEHLDWPNDESVIANFEIGE